MEIFRQITANNIELKEYPFLKELAMEAYLMENEDILKLDAQDFAEVTVLDAEIALKKGRKTSNRDGRIDLLARYGFDYLSIIELKINKINADTLLQLEDYLSEKEQLIKKYPDYWNDSDNPPKWVGVLVGSSISPELQRKLQDGYQTKDGVPVAGMIIRRFRSKENNIFVITDTFFKYNYTSKDYSKFEFRGETFSKGRLVNRVIKAFIESNPNLTYAELERSIPQNLHRRSLGVFMEYEKAKEIYDRTGRKRHYLNPEELIKLSDSVIATCNQWGIGNIVHFVKHMNSMGSEWGIKIV